MREYPYVDPYSVQNNWNPTAKTLVIDMDRDNALTAGVSRDDVANALLAASEGMPVGVMHDGDNTLLVNLKVRNEDGSEIEDISNIPAGRKLSDLGRSAAQNQLETSRMDVINEADNAYWTYIAVRDKVELMQSYIDMMDTLYSQTATAVEAGMAMNNDLLRITAKRSELLYQKKKAENGAELNHNSDLLDLEVRQAATNLHDGWNMIASARQALDLADENLRVMRNRFEESMAPLTDLLDAHTQWQQARSNMIEAATQYQIYQTA